MYQDLPGNAMELVVDESEQILYVCTLKKMRDMLSGDEKAEPFCFITTERVYFYSPDKGEFKAKCCDIEEIEKTSYHISKKKKALLSLLWCIPTVIAGALLFMFSVSVTGNAVSGGSITEGFSGVMFFANAVLVALLSLVIIVSVLIGYKKSACAVMDVKIKGDDEIFSISLPSAVTDDVKDFEREIRRAKAMRRAVNPETFWG